MRGTDSNIKLQKVTGIDAEIAAITWTIVKYLPIPLLFLAWILYETDEIVKSYITVAIVVPTLFTLVILRKGYIKSAVFYLASLVTVTNTIICITGMGIHDIAIIVFSVIILFSSLMLDHKNLIAIFTLVFASISLITLGDYWHWYTPAPQEPGTFSDALIVSIVSVVAVSIAYLLSRNTLRATNRRKRELDKTSTIKVELISIADKKAELLREVHHRVKNNLAFTSSLIDIEMMSDSENSEYLRDFQSKIISLARANDPLFQSDQYESVELEIYLEELISNSLGHKNITFSMNTISIPVHQAVPIGVIIHEIILIIQKHRERAVTILMSKENSQYLMEIKSDNTSLKQTFDKSHLGKAFVEIMVEELSGQLTIDKCVFELRF